MKCQKNCASKVEWALACMDGVEEAQVDFASRTARVRGDSSLVTVDRIRQCVESAGAFRVVESEKSAGASHSHVERREELSSNAVEMRVEGMKCERSCARNLQWALQMLPGVREAQVSFAQGKVSVVGDVSRQQVLNAILAEGFTPVFPGGGGLAASASSSQPDHGFFERGGQQGDILFLCFCASVEETSCLPFF